MRAAPSLSLAAALVCLCASCAAPGPQPDAVREPPTDLVVVQASSAGRLAYEQGDFSQAQQLYRRALTRARVINDAGLAADAAYNLAMSEVGLGDYDAADQLLVQAYYDAGRAASSTADILLLRAKVAYLRARPPEALALLDAVAGAKTAGLLQLQALTLRGQILGDSADLEAARAALRAVEQAAASAQSVPAPSIRADMAKLEGTIARLDGKTDAAARAFDAEAELLRLAHRYRDMAYALARAAEAYSAAGRPTLAADRFFLAARSMDARGDASAARPFVESSRSAAEKAGDENARARARMLLEEINRRAVP